MNLKLAIPKNLSSIKLPHYDGRPQPERDWSVLLSIAAVLFLVSVAWNTWLFLRVTEGHPIGAEAVQVPTVNTASLESVRAVFKERAEEEEGYRSVYRFVDPSRAGS